jgi:hypothetical protein
VTVRRIVEWLARLCPVPAAASPDLDRALGYVDGPPAEQVVRAGYGAALLAGLLAVVVVPVTGLVPAWTVPLLAASAGLATAHAVHQAPIALARLRRTRALGEAPGLVGRLALRLRLAPAPEEAAAYAARTGDGPLAASLRDHVERARGMPGSTGESGSPSPRPRHRRRNGSGVSTGR